MMDVRSWIEVVAVATMPIGLIILLINRWQLKRGIGARSIQFANSSGPLAPHHYPCT